MTLRICLVTPVVLSIQNRPISHTANTGTDLVLFHPSVGSVILHTNPRESLHNNIRAGLVRFFERLSWSSAKTAATDFIVHAYLKPRELPHTPAKGMSLAHTAEAGAFVLGGCRLGGRNVHRNEQINRTRAKSQQIVVQDYSHAYNTRFCI